MPDPILEARQEQANGPAGNSTQIVGGSVVLPPGLPGLATHRAAALREEAGSHWVRVDTVAAVCGVREATLDLWLAEARLARVTDAQDRLTTLHERSIALARAGEVAGYDRDRLALTVERHRVVVDRQKRDRAEAVAALRGWLVDAPQSVTLLPMAELPALEQAVSDAVAGDPMLQALRQEQEAARVSLSAARRGAVPDLTISGGARWDAMPDGSERTPGYEVGVAVSLPVFDRNQVAVRGAMADLAELDARVARREAEVRAAVELSWAQAESLGPAIEGTSTDTVWDGARRRYGRGESSVDELLTVAADVEETELARLAGVEMRRRARLGLACTVGTFPEDSIQTLIEETLR